MHMFGSDSNSRGISTFQMHSRREGVFLHLHAHEKETVSSYVYSIGDDLVMHSTN
jgi:hypothetical protein